MKKIKIPGWLAALSAIGAGTGALILMKDSNKGVEYKSEQKMHGRTVIVTGANSGLGKETAKDLANRGARVIMACRDLKKCEEVREEIMEFTFNKNVHCHKLDLASLKSVQEFAENINQTEKRLDVLINNAGIMVNKRDVTEDGFEMMLGVNHLGPFLLTNLLLDKLKASAPSRIINVTSISYLRAKLNFDDINWENSFYWDFAYGQTKLFNIFFTKQLEQQLEGTGISTYAVNPGATRTGLGRHLEMNRSKISSSILWPLWWLALKTPEQGAQSIIFTAVEPEIAAISGKYWENCDMKETDQVANNMRNVERLWLISEKWTRLK